jgi:hypothetical protein
LNAETPLLISHIPKTAGTSLRKLVEQFNPDAVLAYDRELALGNPNAEFIRNFKSRPQPKVVLGHFSFGVHKLLDVPPRYASIFRDPIQRVISLYWYQKSHPNSPFAKELQSGMSLGEFVLSGCTAMTNNHMCRMVAGIAPQPGVFLNERWMLDQALYNLKNYYQVIGVVENYGQALTQLAEILGWKEFEIPKENVTPGKVTDIDDVTYEILHEYNELDIELFKTIMKMHQPSQV